MTELTNLPLNALDLNEAARPSMSALAGVTEAQRGNGRQLAAIHRHYLMEMRRVAAVLERIKLGDAAPVELRKILLSADMSENLKAAGTICGHQCHVLKMHHDIEESHMFPGLAAAGHLDLSHVVEKLRSEHKVVHELLDRLHAAADQLVQTPVDAHFAQAHDIFAALQRAVVSHFGYEETELAEALGVFLDAI